MASSLAKITMTVPKPMLKAADRIAAAEYRTRAEVFREALREYIGRRGPRARATTPRPMTREEFERAAAAIPLDDEPYTAAERRRAREGEAAAARGNFVTLDQFLAEHANVARRRPRSGK